MYLSRWNGPSTGRTEERALSKKLTAAGMTSFCNHTNKVMITSYIIMTTRERERERERERRERERDRQTDRQREREREREERAREFSPYL